LSCQVSWSNPSRPLVTLVERDDVWVLASFRKDQLVHVHTGQRATVHVGERAFDARVDGVVRAGSPVRLEFANRPDVRLVRGPARSWRSRWVDSAVCQSGRVSGQGTTRSGKRLVSRGAHLAL